MWEKEDTLTRPKTEQPANLNLSVTDCGQCPSLPVMLIPTEVAPESITPSSLERPFLRLRRVVSAAASNGLGLITAVLTLAVISAIPVLNLLSLGYLLESSGRVARSGRLRDGFIGLSRFSDTGRIALSCWIWFLPLRLIYSFWRDAELIEPGGDAAVRLRIVLALACVVIGVHLTGACLRGGKWRHFFLPAPLQWLQFVGGNVEYSALVRRNAVFLKEMQLLYFFSLGARGFAGAAIWLAFPLMVLMFFGSITNPGLAVLGSLGGSVLLAGVCLYLPFLQTRFSMTGRFAEFFSIAATRDLFCRAPLAFWMALLVTLLFALPLYLLKIELTPNEIAWLPNLVFVLFIYPARLLLGWAVSRAERRKRHRIWLSRWAARLAAIPVVGAYAFIVWLTQYLSWHGSLSLLEQHAFLVPAPLFGL